MGVVLLFRFVVFILITSISFMIFSQIKLSNITFYPFPRSFIFWSILTRLESNPLILRRSLNYRKFSLPQICIYAEKSFIYSAQSKSLQIAKIIFFMGWSFPNFLNLILWRDIYRFLISFQKGKSRRGSDHWLFLDFYFFFYLWMGNSIVFLRIR